MTATQDWDARRAEAAVEGLAVAGQSRAAAYCRLSKNPDGTLESTERQKRVLKGLAKSRGITITRFYVDDNLSAWKRGIRRPGWEAMMRALEGDKHDLIMSYHSDRLARNGRDGERMIDVADRKNLPLITPSAEFDLGGSGDQRFTFRIIVAVAIKSSDDTSRRVTDALRDRRSRGQLIANGCVPFGWTRIDGKLVIDEEQAAVLREAARRLLAKEKFATICADLEAQGVRLRKVRRGEELVIPIAPTTLREALKAPRTGGWTAYKRSPVARIPGGGPLDEDTWRRVVVLLNARATGRPRSDAYPLAGLLSCGVCGNLLNGNEGAYSCRRPHRMPTGRMSPCFGVTVRAKAVEAEVEAAMIVWLADPANREGLVSETTEANERTGQIEVDLDEARELLGDLADKRARGRLTKKRYDVTCADLEARMTALEEERASIATSAVSRFDPTKAYGDQSSAEQRDTIRQAIVTPMPVSVAQAGRSPGERVSIVYA